MVHRTTGRNTQVLPSALCQDPFQSVLKYIGDKCKPFSTGCEDTGRMMHCTPKRQTICPGGDTEAMPEAAQTVPEHKTVLGISKFSNTVKASESVLCNAFLKSRCIFHFSTDNDNSLFY